MDMFTIEIDAELYSYLKDNIADFGETPNSVLKRLLKVSLANPQPTSNQTQETQAGKKVGLRRSPQTSLSKLISEGKLRADEELRLIINGKEMCKAKIEGDLISWKNERFSMSGLAVKFLRQEGYKTNHARGPAFWFTGEGKSIKELWDQYLRSLEYLLS